MRGKCLLCGGAAAAEIPGKLGWVGFCRPCVVDKVPALLAAVLVTGADPAALVTSAAGGLALATQRYWQAVAKRLEVVMAAPPPVVGPRHPSLKFETGITWAPDFDPIAVPYVFQQVSGCYINRKSGLPALRYHRICGWATLSAAAPDEGMPGFKKRRVFSLGIGDPKSPPPAGAVDPLTAVAGRWAIATDRCRQPAPPPAKP